MIGSILLALFSPILGTVLLIGAGIGIVIVNITKLVYLYRTAKVFREFSDEIIGL